MKKTIEEIRNSEEYKNSYDVEYYDYDYEVGKVHQENLCFIDEEQLKYFADEDGRIDVDIFLMGEQEYNEKLLCNCSVVFTDLYPKDAKICIVIARP